MIVELKLRIRDKFFAINIPNFFIMNASLLPDVFINRTSSYLPNAPVNNEDIELYLGKINGIPSRSRSIILRQNKIKTRYYALDTDQQITHTNAELAKMP